MKAKDKNIKNLFGYLSNDHPFTVPENYFENFSERLHARIKQEELRNKKRTLFIALRPFLKYAAIFVIALLLVYVPFQKYFPSEQGTIALNRSEQSSEDSMGGIRVDLISNFSEEQLISAYADMDILETKTISSENLADYITANCSDYEILTNN